MNGLGKSVQDKIRNKRGHCLVRHPYLPLYPVYGRVHELLWHQLQIPCSFQIQGANRIMTYLKENITGIHLLMDVDAEQLFADQSTDWQYCMAHASFKHQDACEFMVYCGGDAEAFTNKLKQMDSFGCSQDFISIVKYARDKNSLWLLLHVG